MFFWRVVDYRYAWWQALSKCVVSLCAGVCMSILEEEEEGGEGRGGNKSVNEGSRLCLRACACLRLCALSRKEGSKSARHVPRDLTALARSSACFGSNMAPEPTMRMGFFALRTHAATPRT